MKWSFTATGKRRALCFLALLLIISFYDVVFLNKTFKVTTANSQALPTGAYGQENNKPAFIPVNGTDSPVLEEPVYEFIKQNLKKGILPLWNPHQACGFSLIGMIQVGIFFPLHIILYLFPQLYGWDILILVRVLLAGFFAYWFMRSMECEEIPSLATAIAFMLSGPMLLLQYWTANVDILTPVLLIALDRLIRQNKTHNIVFLAVTVALTFFAGHPEHIFLVNVYGFTFFVFRLIHLRKTANIKKTIAFLLTSYTLGIGLSAIVLFPFLHTFISEAWHGHPEGVGLFMEEQRNRAITLALPHFFQKAPITYQWQFAGWWGGYIGTLPFALAVMSLFNRHKKGLASFFAAMTVIIIGKQYGVPVINWLGHLPLFNVCRYAIHTPPLAAFSVAVLAGLGIQSILDSKNVFRKGLWFSVSLLVLAIIHMIFFSHLTKEEIPFTFPLYATLFALGVLVLFQLILFLKDKKILSQQWIALLLVGVLFAELFCYIHRERPNRFNSFGKVPYMEFLKASPQHVRGYGLFWAFYPNTATGFGVDDLGYFFGLVPKRFVKFTNTFLKENHFQNNLRPPALRAIPILDREPFLNLLNVGYIVTPKNVGQYLRQFPHYMDQIKNSLAQPVYAKEVNIHPRKEAFPRAFIVHKAIFEPNEEKALFLMKQIQNKLRFVAVINHPPIQKLSAMLKDLPLTDKSVTEIIKYSPNEVIVGALMENPGFLVLSDAYHPDWKVYVNGKDWKLFQTDYLIRSVFLPKGKYQVRFVFEPKSFYLGGYVSLAALLILILLCIFPRLKKQPTPK